MTNEIIKLKLIGRDSIERHVKFCDETSKAIDILADCTYRTPNDIIRELVEEALESRREHNVRRGVKCSTI